MFNKEIISKILPTNKTPEIWCGPLDLFLPIYEVNNVNRISMFFAQCSHESNQFTVLSENLNYSVQGLLKTFPKYFPNQDIANSYARNPQKIANRIYANRMGNGDELSGDGWKYRGKSIIQCTGKNNHQEFATFLKKSIEETIAYLLTPHGSVEYACFFWKTRNLNTLSDKEDIPGTTKVINGGKIGLEHRTQEYARIKPIVSELII